jgi:hypothetical protein
VGRLLVVVSLRPGTSAEVASLLRKGPPLPVGDGGLDRCGAFVSPLEAVFLFEGPEVSPELSSAWRDVSRWTDGDRWKGLSDGPPRVAESIMSWQRAPDMEGFFFGPLPGPGDSEGGMP